MTSSWTRRAAAAATAVAVVVGPSLVAPAYAAARAGGEVAASSGALRGTTILPSGTGYSLVAVGDIAREGGAQAQTAALVADLAPQTLLALGDNAYNKGSAAEFAQWYDPAYGRFAATTWPVPGNHEYFTPGAAGYRSYFGVTGPTWWARRAGSWLVLGLDSEKAGSSAQRAFVLASLRANQGRPTIVAWHRPRYSSGIHRDQRDLAALWKLVARDRDVQLALWGHDHDYERMLVPVRDRRAKAAFVVGTGGAELRPVKRHKGRTWSRRIITGHYGVLDIRLRATSFSWRFVRTDGVVSDAGSRKVARR
jgi:hypothetical protein